MHKYLDNAAGPFSCAGEYLAFERIPRFLRSNFAARTNTLLARYGDDWSEVEYIVVALPGPNGTTTGKIFATLQVPLSQGNVTIPNLSMAD